MSHDIVRVLSADLQRTFPPVPDASLGISIGEMTQAAVRALADPVAEPEPQNRRGRGRTHGMVMSLPDDRRPVHVVVHNFHTKAEVLRTIRNKRGAWYGQFVRMHDLVDVARGSLLGIDRSRIFWDHEAERLARIRAGSTVP